MGRFKDEKRASLQRTSDDLDLENYNSAGSTVDTNEKYKTAIRRDFDELDWHDKHVIIDTTGDYK